MRSMAIMTSIALASVALSIVPPPAALPDTSDITVPGPGFSVRITQTPFAMQILNSSGQPVLTQVPGNGGPRLVHNESAKPLGVTPSEWLFPTRYTPFTFTVGTSSATPFPISPLWLGDLWEAGTGGMQYAATGVLSTRPLPQGQELTLSTDDPSGRTLAVTLSADSGRLRVSVVPSSTQGIVAMGDSFASPSGERFAGFGGVHSGLDQRGARFANWVQEANVGAGPLSPLFNVLFASSGGPHYLFPGGPQSAYYVQPQFVSTAGYGFLLAQSELADWHLDSDRPDAWQVNVAAAHLDYEVAVGDPGQVISALSAANGRHRVPPAWALGTQLDRRIVTGQTGNDYAAVIRSDLANILAYNLPVTAYRIEAWLTLDPTVLRQLISEFGSHGIHVLLYVRSFVSMDPLRNTSPADYRYAVANNYVATHANGKPYICGSPNTAIGGQSAVIDFTNPAAKAWFQHTVREVLETGADGFMSDFGEQTLPDMHFANGQTGATMHNAYPTLYQQVVREAVDAYEQSHPGRSIWFYNRAGYTGSTGYEGGNFPGDESTDFSVASGLGALIPDMLNRGLAGAYGYGTDIGGYQDLLAGATTKELLVRWSEMAALSPIMRLHGAHSGTHMPWDFDQETVDIFRQVSELRRRAIPLISATWATAASTGVPLSRPVWLAAPNDRQAWAADQEWMIGSDVLVAPVVTQGATSRKVYFPPGCWNRQDSDGNYTGPSEATVSAPLASLPYFARCNTGGF